MLVGSVLHVLCEQRGRRVALLIAPTGLTAALPLTGNSKLYVSQLTSHANDRIVRDQELSAGHRRRSRT